MPHNVYECLFLFDSNRYARDPNGVSGSVPSMIEKVEGEILASRLWNEQKLAYPIEGHRKGTYWLTYFRMDSARITEFNRACQLNDALLRHMVIKVDPRLTDVLVAHAQGKPASQPAASESKVEEKPAEKQPEAAETT